MAQAMHQQDSTHDSAKLAEAIQSRIDSKQLKVPVLPKIAQQVLILTQDPDSSAEALSKLIQGDQSLAAHVMRIANSAAYSPNATMQSLQQATARLGMQTIAEIALAATMNGNLFKVPGYEPYVEDLLKASLATGLWAKEVARLCRKNVESAFLVGLLVDIGRPVVIQTALECAEKTGHVITPDEMQAHEKAFQKSVGSTVISSWDMPRSILKTIELLDNYGSTEDSQTQIVVAGAALAQATLKGEEFTQLCTHPVFAMLNLYQDEVETVFNRKDKVFSALEAMSQHG